MTQAKNKFAHPIKNGSNGSVLRKIPSEKIPPLASCRPNTENREADTTVQLGEIQRLTFINDQLEKQVRALSTKGTP